MKNLKKILCVVLAVVLIAASVCVLASCKGKVIFVWGPSDHEAIYMEYLNKFAEEHKDQLNGYKFEYAGSGDAGAYAAMNIDPTTGAGVYTFANDQMANLRNLGALSPIRGANLEWSKTHNVQSAFDATWMGDTKTGQGEYLAYPLQADNGYYMYYNKAAFRGTKVWDSTKDALKAGYTFRDLYEALESKPDQMEADGKTNWHNGIVTWAMGDSWYVSGVFFSVGGDYEVIYDKDGAQIGADCWFSYVTETGDWEDGDFTVGEDAYQCLKNSITEADGKTVSSHYLYSDGDKDPLNDYIDTYTNPANEKEYKTPLAAAVCGTWKAKALQAAWGDDYAATVLPTLVTDDDEHFQMKNFAGYKHMGVNPMCQFAQESPENLQLLHELAQYLCGVDISVARYDSTGAGPANLEALAIDKIKNDAALVALNSQYALHCTYPSNYSVVSLRGKDIGNGLGYRNQDSVPANYWTPIQQFGNTLYKELSGQVSKDRFKDADAIRYYLAELQAEIAKAAQ